MIRINFEENKAVVTKAFMKKACIYGTDEYKEWRICQSENPGISMEVKTIKKNPNRETNKNMTYENMIATIRVLDNSEELLAEMEKHKKLAATSRNEYQEILKWYKSKIVKMIESEDVTSKKLLVA